jgi:hypothetical protein
MSSSLVMCKISLLATSIHKVNTSPRQDNPHYPTSLVPKGNPRLILFMNPPLEQLEELEAVIYQDFGVSIGFHHILKCVENATWNKNSSSKVHNSLQFTKYHDTRVFM